METSRRINSKPALNLGGPPPSKPHFKLRRNRGPTRPAKGRDFFFFVGSAAFQGRRAISNSIPRDFFTLRGPPFFHQ